MPISSPVFKPSNVSVDILNAESVEITNLSIAAANTEYSHAIQGGTKQLIIKNRDKTAVTKIAFVSGESGTKYMTLNGSSVMVLDNIDFTSKTLYVQASAISTLEIMELYT